MILTCHNKWELFPPTWNFAIGINKHPAAQMGKNQIKIESDHRNQSF